jgi:hypothetical protein
LLLFRQSCDESRLAREFGDAIFRKALLGLSVLVPVLLSLYAMVPTIFLFKYSDPMLAYFPPFTERASSTNHGHLGAEYWHVTESIARGDGYSSPFGIVSGPTAWMPPALPTVLAGIHVAAGREKSRTVLVYVVLNLAVFAWVAWNVAQTSLKTTKLASRWLLKWTIPLSILVVFVANFNDNFQRTHDGTLLLLVMHLIVAFVMVEHDWGGKRWALVHWGVLGGIASLSSPAILVAWLAMSLRYVILLRHPKLIALAIGDASIDSMADGPSTSETSTGSLVYVPETNAYLSQKRMAIAVLIAFMIQTPWLVRNYIQFSKFVPVKNNGLFELEQSLLRDDDGVVDFGIDLHHPFADRKEANLHAEMGEVAYVEQRVKPLREKFWERKWVYVEHCCNRVFAMLVWQMPLTPNEERYTWTHVVRILYAIPWIVFLTSLVPDIPLSKSQKNVLLLAVVFLLPYALLSYYSRYVIPLMGVRCLLLIWGIDRWSTFVSSIRAKAIAVQRFQH